MVLGRGFSLDGNSIVPFNVCAARNIPELGQNICLLGLSSSLLGKPWGILPRLYLSGAFVTCSFSISKALLSEDLRSVCWEPAGPRMGWRWWIEESSLQGGQCRFWWPWLVLGHVRTLYRKQSVVWGSYVARNWALAKASSGNGTVVKLSMSQSCLWVTLKASCGSTVIAWGSVDTGVWFGN